MRILIVDDQKHARNGLRVLLSAAMPGATIREAADGLEAQRAAEEFRPHLVLMDVRMPQVDGLEATRWIKDHLAGVSVVLLSLHAECETEALAAGADAFLCKDERPQRLLQTLACLARETRGP